MAVDKALNRAPLGMADDEDPLDVVIGANTVMLEDGGMEITLGEDDDADEASEAGEKGGFDANLVDEIDSKLLASLASELLSEFENDCNSRKDWIETYADGLELLGLKVEERTEPWPGACGVHHPLLSEALVKFQADAMTETFPSQGPVKTQILGKETPEKRDAATRVKEDMNYQLTEKMTEYRPEHERLLWGLGLAGNAFKKVYYDPALRRQTALFVPAEDIVVPYGASSLETSPRVTHVMRKTPNEVRKLQRAGFYIDVELPEPSNTLEEVEKKIAESMGFSAVSDDRHKLLEFHVDLDLEGHEDKDKDGDTGIALPYVVTIDKESETILAIRRNWKKDDKLKTKRNHFVHYSYIPGFGFYAFGLIHLIGAFAKSGTSLIRQLVDAGTLSNLPGGFKTKGLRVKGDDSPVSPGEWRDVDVGSGTLRDNLMPLPYKEPSQTLYALLNTIVEEGRRFASAADLKISDMSAQAPVGTTLAILERTLKVMSAVQARVHYAMRQEFRLIRDIIRDYTPDDYTYDPEDGTRRAKKTDYELVEVIPVSDPNAATMAQKVVQYQAVLQLAQGAPQIYDLPYLHRQMLDVLGVKNASKIIPLSEEDDKPRDPVSENMAVLAGKGVKAFLSQDHEAHITVHMAAMQDPQVAKVMGQNPQAQVMMAAMQAHISEHLGFEYRKRIEEASGVPYPPPNAEMTPELEVQISRLAAAAAKQVLQTSQQKAAAEQAQQAAQDPIVQMQQQELALKAKEVELKEKKLQVDAAATNDKITNEQERIKSQERIAGMNAGVTIATSKATLAAKQQEAGLRIGIDAASEMSRQKLTEKQMEQNTAKTQTAQPDKKEKPNEQQ